MDYIIKETIQNGLSFTESMYFITQVSHWMPELSSHFLTSNPVEPSYQTSDKTPEAFVSCSFYPLSVETPDILPRYDVWFQQPRRLILEPIHNR